MCSIGYGDLPYPPGMTKAEYNAIIDAANQRDFMYETADGDFVGLSEEQQMQEWMPTFSATGNLYGFIPGYGADRKATIRDRKSYANQMFQAWMDENPEDRYRLGVLAAKGLPTTQNARSAQGAPNPNAGASAAAQGESGGDGGGSAGVSETFELGSGALLQQKRKNLLGV